MVRTASCANFSLLSIETQTARFLLFAGLLLLALPSLLSAQIWNEQGPGPTTGGQVEGIANRPVSGGVNAIVTVPGSPNTLYVGAINGGVWKTTNALAASPTWVPLTDQQLPALSINSLALSPLDTNTIFGGTGSTSSDGFDGSAGFGVVKSTDGGTTWSILAASTFTGRRINSIVPTSCINPGQVVLAGTLFDGGGLYRSTDGGANFTRLSGNGLSGLPNGGISQIAADPGISTRFYAGVPTNYLTSGVAGVYKSDDCGATWVPVNTGLNVTNTYRILLSVHNDPQNDVAYAMVILTNGSLSGIYRSANQVGNWTLLATPSPNIYPGGQGILHGAISAHPTNPNVVFISGDRQNSPFPNTNGCNNFSGNVFRGDASQPAASQWANVVCNGANGTSPHADSRALVFDSAGNILHACDGGLYKLVNPDTPTSRVWTSLQGNIRPAEFSSAAFDRLSNIVFGGTQDNGTPMQNSPGAQTWFDFLQGDGGIVAIDNDSLAHPGTSIRYSSFDFLESFNRSTWGPANNFISQVLVGLHIVSGTGTGQDLDVFDPNIQFYNPYVLNNLDPSRMLIGTANIYESTNRGDSLTNLGFTGQFIAALSYGSRLNGVPFPGAFYVGLNSNQILHRVTQGGSITTLSAYPGSTVRSVIMDPQNYQHVFVADTLGRVWASTDEGATWTNLTANLPSLMTDVRVLEIFSPSSSPINTVLVAGGQGGVFQMRRPGAAGAAWAPLGTNLPHALFTDLRYDYPCDVLTAASLGRGVFTITGAFRGASTASCPAAPALAGDESDPAGAVGTLPEFPVRPPVAFPGNPGPGSIN